jgi:hypothetical protein
MLYGIAYLSLKVITTGSMYFGTEFLPSVAVSVVSAPKVG